MKKKWFFLAIMIYLVTSSMGQQGFHIEGSTDTTFNGQYIHIYGIDWSGLNAKINDSCLIKNGRFMFNGHLETPGLLVSMYSGGSPRSFTQVYIENRKINIVLKETEWGKKTNCIVSNAPLNVQYEKWKTEDSLANQRWKLQYKMDSLSNTHPDSSLALLQQQEDSLKTEELKERMNFVRNHPQNYISLVALSYFMFENMSADTLFSLYNKLSENLKVLPEGKILLQRIQAKSAIHAGNNAPEFAIKDTSGTIVSLNNFKGSYVLLDFWASWCGPCIEKIPELKAFYKKNKSKGLKIISISLDNKKENWVKAIEKYQLNWTNVSELKTWNGSVSKSYNISYIPQTILIDKTGKIIAVDVDFSKEYF